MKKITPLIKFLWHYLNTTPHMRFVRYLMVGTTNMIICFTFMYIGSALGLHYLEYTVLGYAISILYSFFMNLRFTFRVSGNITKRLIAFFVINFTNLGIVEVIEYVMISVYGLNPLFSIICAMLWYSIAGFTVNALWVYRH